MFLCPNISVQLILCCHHFNSTQFTLRNFEDNCVNWWFCEWNTYSTLLHPYSLLCIFGEIFFLCRGGGMSTQWNSVYIVFHRHEWRWWRWRWQRHFTLFATTTINLRRLSNWWNLIKNSSLLSSAHLILTIAPHSTLRYCCLLLFFYSPYTFSNARIPFRNVFYFWLWMTTGALVIVTFTTAKR